MTASRPFEDLIEFLAKMAPEEVLAFRASDATIRRVQTLIEKEKESSITLEEKAELERYLIQEDLMIIAKARAKMRLAQT
jgi:hypothetical protein